MKKIVLIIIVLACSFSHADAQVRFGIKGGLNFDNFSRKNVKDQLTFDNSVGWQAGALLQFKVPVVGLGVQPELLYTVKKAKIDENSNSIHYFEVPVNAFWSFNLIVVRPYLMAGPYFSYAVDFSGAEFNSKIDKFD